MARQWGISKSAAKEVWGVHDSPAQEKADEAADLAAEQEAEREAIAERNHVEALIGSETCWERMKVRAQLDSMPDVTPLQEQLAMEAIPARVRQRVELLESKWRAIRRRVEPRAKQVERARLSAEKGRNETLTLHRLVHDLHARGLKRKVIAGEVGLSISQVGRILQRLRP